MQISSSPPQSENGGNPTIESATRSKLRCYWSKQGEKELINFLIKHKAEVGDSATFKPSVWNTASVLLEKSHVKGGLKTSKVCSDKWTRGCKTALDGGIVNTPTFFKAQGDLQHSVLNQDIWSTLV
jgi:hypothetical protein